MAAIMQCPGGSSWAGRQVQEIKGRESAPSSGKLPGSEPLGGAREHQTGSAPSARHRPRARESGSKRAPKIVQPPEDTHLLPTHLRPSGEAAPTQLRRAEVGEGEGRDGAVPGALGVIPGPTGPAQSVLRPVRRTGLPCTDIPVLEYGAPVPPRGPWPWTAGKGGPLERFQRGAFLH